MPRKAASRVIFRRRLETVKDREPVDVRIYAPQPSAQHAGEWVCRYSVSRIGPINDSRAIGADELQSFLIAYDQVAAMLSSHGSALSWEGAPIRLAFPRLMPYYPDELAERIDAAISSEVERFRIDTERKLVERKKTHSKS